MRQRPFCWEMSAPDRTPAALALRRSPFRRQQLLRQGSAGPGCCPLRLSTLAVATFVTRTGPGVECVEPGKGAGWAGLQIRGNCLSMGTACLHL